MPSITASSTRSASSVKPRRRAHLPWARRVAPPPGSETARRNSLDLTDEGYGREYEQRDCHASARTEQCGVAESRDEAAWGVVPVVVAGVIVAPQLGAARPDQSAQRAGCE